METTQQYYQKNREKILARRREIYNTPEGKEKEKIKTEKYKNRRSEINKARTESYRERRKELDKVQRLKKYNLTPSEYNDLLLLQNKKCAICELEGKLFVDHCHGTKKVRGLLCRKCNSLLGFATDNTETLGSAIKYLEKQKGGEESLSPPSSV